jgi:hypothetical protein
MPVRTWIHEAKIGDVAEEIVDGACRGSPANRCTVRRRHTHGDAEEQRMQNRLLPPRAPATPVSHCSSRSVVRSHASQQRRHNWRRKLVLLYQPPPPQTHGLKLVADWAVAKNRVVSVFVFPGIYQRATPPGIGGVCAGHYQNFEIISGVFFEWALYLKTSLQVHQSVDLFCFKQIYKDFSEKNTWFDLFFWIQWLSRTIAELSISILIVNYLIIPTKSTF